MKINQRPKGFSLSEILIATLISGVVVAGVFSFMKSNIKSSETHMVKDELEYQLSLFQRSIEDDLDKAGADPTGKALNGYIFETICAGKLYFKYGINPEPASPLCNESMGQIGILSYIAYDANNDGIIEPEEGQDLASLHPIARLNPNDYVVYQLRDQTIYRKNVGDPDDSNDDVEQVVLKNAISFVVKYYGYVDHVYGQISDKARYNDIREVEISVSIRGNKAESGYQNPSLDNNSPFKSYRTASRVFRTALMVRKE